MRISTFIFRGGGIVVLALLCLTAVQAKEKTHFEFNMSYLVPSQAPAITLRNFPLSIREVPLHDDDGYLSGCPDAVSPLPDTAIMYRRPTQYFWVRVFWTPWQFCGIGPQYTYMSYFQNGNGEPGGSDSPERYQQNQYGTDSRGYGTSLRYYEPRIAGSSLGLAGFVASPWLHIFRIPYTEAVSDRRKRGWLVSRLKLGGSYDLVGAAVHVESGYDRWGYDQTWKELELGRVNKRNLSLTWEVGFSGADDDPLTIVGQVMYVRTFYRLEGAHSLQISPVKDDLIAFGLSVYAL
ncbi:MAG: hypothetical protein WCT27_04040 [Patescibacteria group bacterium]|jgi:hypothetical protein